ncbi:MAG: aldo/keto reductase [Oscillospiraceae bacterium]|nr:aldo/keto reductase [Oscillospiraceae bacterium]
MEYRSFPAFKTSLLGFGCMRFPTLENGAIDEPLTFKMLDAAYSQGVTYYDTAYPYHGGESERVLGRWHTSKPRESLQLVTKMPLWAVKSQEDVERIFEEQLKKVNTDYFDFYLIHAINGTRWDEVVLGYNIPQFLLKKKAEGKIRHLGFSFHDSYEVFERVINALPWDFCQIQLNYMDTAYQAGLKGYHLAAQKNIPVMVMEPIKGGYLAAPPAEITNSFAALHPNWSPASWALRWVASLPGVAVVLSGMSTPQQVADNLNTFESLTCLNQTEQDAIRQAALLYQARTQVSCTACRYCMPCPMGVRIPDIFGLFNESSMFALPEKAKREYASFAQGTTATACVNCKKCMTHCPQSIQIPVQLQRAHAALK